MRIRLYTQTVVRAALLAMLLAMSLSACSFYTPSRGRVIVEVQSDEAYYAGFFRACEILISQQVEGVYIQVDSALNTTGLEPTDQCLQMVQKMMDAGAARQYSRNWPGMQPLSLRGQGAQYEQIAPPH